MRGGYKGKEEMRERMGIKEERRERKGRKEKWEGRKEGQEWHFIK